MGSPPRVVSEPPGPACMPGENWLSSLRPEIFWKPRSCGSGSAGGFLENRLKTPKAAAGKNVLLRCVMVPEVWGGSWNGSSPPKARASPALPASRRLYHRRTNSSATKTRARPAREPTTLPTMVPVGAVSSLEPPAAAVPLTAPVDELGGAEEPAVPRKPPELALSVVVNEEEPLDDEERVDDPEEVRDECDRVDVTRVPCRELVLLPEALVPDEWRDELRDELDDEDVQAAPSTESDEEPDEEPDKLDAVKESVCIGKSRWQGSHRKWFHFR